RPDASSAGAHPLRAGGRRAASRSRQAPARERRVSVSRSRVCPQGGSAQGLPEDAQGSAFDAGQPLKLHRRMAKKRVHEIAKERGISSKEVIATLQRAGFDVKAAASSVDESDIAKAFNGGDGAQASGQRDSGTAGQASAPKPKQRTPRPTRAAPQRDGGGGGGRRRRVVID